MSGLRTRVRVRRPCPVLRRDGDAWRVESSRGRAGAHRHPRTRRSASRSTPTRRSRLRAGACTTRICRCCARSPVSSRSQSSAAGCAPRPPRPRGSPRRTSCAPRCSRRSRTICGRRSRRSRRRSRACSNPTSTLARRHATSCSRPSTRRPTGSTTSSGNLLDMSRLQTGALELVRRDVGLDEVVPAALQSLGDTAAPGARRRARDAARVRADAALLERAVANVIANALHASPPDRPVRVFAGGDARPRRARRSSTRARASRATSARRCSGRSSASATPQRQRRRARARRRAGFVEAMDGELTIDDTPGGGTTVIITLPAAA